MGHKHNYKLREVQPSKCDPMHFKKFYIFRCTKCGVVIAVSNINLWYGRRASRQYTQALDLLQRNGFFKE